MIRRALAVLLFGASLGAGEAAASPGPQPLAAPPPLPIPVDRPYPGPIRLEVDARDIAHRVIRVREVIPLRDGGPQILLYPEWLPGTHAPRGPLKDLAGLTIRADGRPVAWRRDPVAVSAFHVEAPPGARLLELTFQYLTPTAADQGRIVMTREILDLQWNAVALYPAGVFARQVQVEPSLRLPPDWDFGSALRPVSAGSEGVRFQAVDFETLVDSPVLAGRYVKAVDLDSGPRPVRLTMVADRPELLAATPSQLARLREVVVQADRLYRARHFDHYDFLLGLSERIGNLGLEHHQSTEILTRATYFTNWDGLAATHDTVAHEYTHSWNGKFRRPADLWTADFNTPMRGSLLWVYEGQTQYWGFVLAARSGMLSRQEALDAIANTAATYELRAGRGWRTVADTTADPIVAARRPIPWVSWQRSEDYYQEGELVWLEADTLIRSRSGGRRSLDDFAGAFFGGQAGDRGPLTYRLEDVVAALGRVQAYDWAGFLRDRIDRVQPHAPLEGLARGGYRLVFTAEPTGWLLSNETRRGIVDLTFSAGLVLNTEGVVTGVQWEGPAYEAGLLVGDRMVSVDGEPYSPSLLRAAIRRAAERRAPIELILRSQDQYRALRLSYFGGLRYPRLERTGPGPAMLDQILTPKEQ